MLCLDVLELFLSFIYFAICITTLIWRFTKGDMKYFLIEYEMWSLMLELVYYLFFLIIGFTTVFNKSKHEGSFYNFLKSIIFKFIWPFVVNSAAIFYMGYFFGWYKLEIDIHSNDFWYSLFLHGISQVGFVIDLIFFHRDYKPTHVFDFIVISGIFVGYCFLLFLIKPQVKIYAFLEMKEDGNYKEDNMFILSLMIVTYFIYLYLYFFYMTIVRIKCGFAKLFESDEDIKENEKIKPINAIEKEDDDEKEEKEEKEEKDAENKELEEKPVLNNDDKEEGNENENENEEDKEDKEESE